MASICPYSGMRTYFIQNRICRSCEVREECIRSRQAKRRFRRRKRNRNKR